jgi:phosphoglycolate phosphatase-like HAD superfamily hydrolase
VRLILFDIDGTLMASGGVGMRALGRAMHEVTGLDLALLGVLPDGKTDPGIVREAFLLGGLSEESWAASEAALLARYPEYLVEELAAGAAGLRVLPGVVALLEHLSAHPGFQLGLLTGNLERTARLKLESVGLSHYFPVGGYGSDCHQRENLGRYALERARQHYQRDYPPDRVWVVGDTERDVQAARALQARVLAVATGRQSRGQLEEHLPDACLEDLSQLEVVLELLTRDSRIL